MINIAFVNDIGECIVAESNGETCMITAKFSDAKRPYISMDLTKEEAKHLVDALNDLLDHK